MKTMDRTTFSAGDRLVFFAYNDPSMADAEKLFKSGDHLVVTKVNEDGGLQCFAVDESGHIMPANGDTLFPEEVISTPYAPKLNVKQLFSL